MQFYKPEEYRHVSYKWDDAYATKLDPVERLVYRSNILGDDQRVTNTGGGNTSSKIKMPDPLTGEQVEVMWVKGSGGDLRTSKRANFASLYMDKLMRCKPSTARRTKKVSKPPLKTRWWRCIPHCVYNLNPRATSIDTPLHAFIPYSTSITPIPTPSSPSPPVRTERH